MNAPLKGKYAEKSNAATAPDMSAMAVLTIDLAALRKNYVALKSVVGKSECAAVVKADAYGLGTAPVVKALQAEGCKTFFVATLDEARIVRSVAPFSVVYVLDGLFPGMADRFHSSQIRPVLGSLAEIEEWALYCSGKDVRLPAAIQLDTGMNRLGLHEQELNEIAPKTSLLNTFEISLVMSHLACADDPASTRNKSQLHKFQAMAAKLPPAPASLANSAGIMQGQAFHFDIVRPGIALYGGKALLIDQNPMVPVIKLEGRILQIRTAEAGDTVGYGATCELKRNSRLAVISTGYADGYMRLIGQEKTAQSAYVYIGDYRAPLTGRVSMDFITADVTDIPEGLASRGQFAELIGPHIPIDDFANLANTISYEILCRLGSRLQRNYIGE